MPAFLIGFVCFLAIFLACGMYHSRRRRRLLLMQSFAFPNEIAPSDLREIRSMSRKKKKRLVKPELFEVEVQGTQWDTDLEALLPVAAELPRGSGSSRPTSLVVVPQERSRRPWYIPTFLFTHRPQPPTPTNLPGENTQVMQQAQLAFLLSMPAPHLVPGQPAPELVLGTTRVSYRGEPDGDDEAEDLLRKIDWTA
ncbi:uncharacterized protein PHACADRAFT_251369 [Phanerochaete carnosa HHB-10118-sp]|uniref:Uncharacterized protein n=1 Tax=Phanerochaete carnosa (strain HHB-10118-sp) TaxID=650164 RepID=K5WEX5_PHACS|nr:uncharacterized protein PHACADRAFT_251369 [Phanerochaete carnosa HHB-10118-sp]EKM57634.1 hypothetical protein PHACADRAFT_251369 [Phanerochaete carnosa HHB-10118-sp]